MAETRCPTCGGPATIKQVGLDMHGNPTDGEDWWGHRNVYRTTATDPATVGQMREVLKEITEARYTYDDSRRMDGDEWGVVSLPVAKWRDWRERIAALLGPATTESGRA